MVLHPTASQDLCGASSSFLRDLTHEAFAHAQSVAPPGESYGKKDNASVEARASSNHRHLNQQQNFAKYESAGDNSQTLLEYNRTMTIVARLGLRRPTSSGSWGRR